MKNIPPNELLLLMFKYIDKEKLYKENPGITERMIDSLIQNISCRAKGKGIEDTNVSHSATPHPKEGGFTHLIVHTDGASRGNPGEAGIGIVVFNKNYQIIEEICKYIGKSTNNVAEYQAMILAAQKAIDYNAKKVTFKTDSELLVRQLKGMYQVKSTNILPLYHKLIALLKKIPVWEIQHVRREENVGADALANQGIDSRT
ncbi:MAG: ribonuclease HI family protein [Candidatus Loosdrechtia sp.]|uniref:ribonuclease HI family protein n=1 Tax=Candidatus Loosdrechtia sp. TaxID=3101272 RepID=UPI003A6EABBE|nr:MAG: ribonuclease HI family protein [Candidatus Jettenia sp. AMX2]